MNAFQDGRVGLWVNDPANGRSASIAALWGGMFTDIFLPASASRLSYDIVRRTKRADGALMKAQMYAIPRSGEAPAQFVARVSAAITDNSPGVVELDIEVPDVALGQYLRDTVTLFRMLRKTFIMRLNLAPFKIGFLPMDLVKNDPNLYVASQAYYGDMSRVDELDLRDDALAAGVPANKFQICYGAAGPTHLNGTRGITLPNVLYRGQFSGRNLRGGLVFDDDLLAEMGLL